MSWAARMRFKSQATLVLKANVRVQDPVQMNRTRGGVVEVTLKALHCYTAADDDELSFEKGDEIVKLSEPDSEGMI